MREFEYEQKFTRNAHEILVTTGNGDWMLGMRRLVDAWSYREREPTGDDIAVQVPHGLLMALKAAGQGDPSLGVERMAASVLKQRETVKRRSL